MEERCLIQFKNFLQKETKGAYDIKHVETLKSAQQRVLVVKVTTSCVAGRVDEKPIAKALQDGNGCLILRIWKGGARWWNLNSNTEGSVLTLAKSEIAGYRIARYIFEYQYSLFRKNSTRLRILIPEVLYFNSDKGSDKENDCSDQNENPWAILSYAKQNTWLRDGNGTFDFCTDFVTKMVKVRKEFGFDEPHPRHGRVCVNDALEYATIVMDTVILPMHTFFYSKKNHFCDWMKREVRELEENGPHANLMSNIEGGFSFRDMIVIHQHMIFQLKGEASLVCPDDKLESLISVLDECIKRLQSDSLCQTQTGFLLPHVLCHMDLQPQNMVFCQCEKRPLRVPQIVSVLDWEESCYADPRFEILLLCRKVAANFEQADTLWKHYNQELGKIMGENDKNLLGSIYPWLQLESVHSLLMMCMQDMDMQAGGRNPWELKSDLWEKIFRELYRLSNDLGWNFCKL